MEFFYQLNLFFGTYKEIATAFYSFFGFLSALAGVAFIIFKVKHKKERARIEKDKEIFERLKYLEIEMNHINHPKTGRIHKVSILCERIISESIETRGIASEALGLSKK